jgi:hypothetical protein
MRRSLAHVAPVSALALAASIVLGGCGIGANGSPASLPAPSVGTVTPVSGAVDQTRGVIANALASISSVAIQFGAASRPYRPPESGRLRDAPRAVYQVLMPDLPDAGFIVVYEFPDAATAAEAAADQAAYLATGPARVQSAVGSRHVMRLVGSTVVLYSWVPEGASDAQQPDIQPALETLGTGVAIPS